MRGYKAWHDLAVLYQEQGRAAEAEAHWRAALALLGLAEAYLAQGRWPELDEATHHLANGAGMPVEAAVIRDRAHAARSDSPAARQTLESAIVLAPQALWPRVILSHVLLQEGKDFVAAEKALRDVLSLEPGNVEARSNLQVLLQQQGRVLTSI